jgi:beta-barrel assembly-enhancing protease
MKRMTLTIRTLSLGLVLCISALTVAAQKSQNVYDKFRDRNPTNDGLLSEADELKFADEVHRQLLNPPRQEGVQEKEQPKPLRLIEGTALDAYVNDLGQRLARNSKRPNIPWRFYVVDDNAVNAFATLGGRVYIHTGLIAKVQSEAQLASVMGHEIGHIVGRHGLENVKKANSMKVQGPVILGTILGAVLGGEGGAQLGNMVGGLLAGSQLMKHGRDAEREADYLGLYNMERTGYNTAGMTEMFGILAQLSQGGGGGLGSILASHPDPRERAQNTQVEIEQYLRSSNQRGTQTTDNFQRVKSGLPAMASTSGPQPASNRNTRPREGGSSTTAPTIRRRPRP